MPPCRLGYVAAARLQAGKRAAAKDALREAMRRDPKYLYAPVTLLQTETEDREWDQAEDTVRFLAEHHPGAPALGGTARLATRRHDEKRAGNALGELARLRPADGSDVAELQEAVRLMVKAGWRTSVEAALRPGLRDPDAFHPEVGAYWVQARAGLEKWWSLGKTVRRLPEGEFARRARRAYLAALGEQRRTFRLLDFLRRQRAPLQADTPGWGQAGYALVRCRLYGRTVRWMSGWAARPDAEGWMLLNLATAYRQLRRHGKALEVHRRALALPPDHSRRKHVAWVALEEALTDGDDALARAAQLRAEAPPEPDDQEQPYRYLNVLTQQLLVMRRLTDPAARWEAFGSARTILRDERRPLGARMRATNPALYRAERRARWRLACGSGRRWPRVAFWLFSPPASTWGLCVYMLAWIVVIVAVCLAVGAFLASLSPSTR